MTPIKAPAPADAARAGMRPALKWALGASLIATAWTVLSSDGKAVGASSKEQALNSADASGTASRSAPQPAKSAGQGIGAIPVQLASQPLEAADRDPFMIPPPPAPPAPPAPPPPPPPPPPTAPPMTYRFLGQFVDPQQQRKVFLGRSDGKEVLVEVGTQLDGYRVDAITADEVRLVYEPLQQTAVIRLPVETRAP